MSQEKQLPSFDDLLGSQGGDDPESVLSAITGKGDTLSNKIRRLEASNRSEPDDEIAWHLILPIVHKDDVRSMLSSLSYVFRLLGSPHEGSQQTGMKVLRMAEEQFNESVVTYKYLPVVPNDSTLVKEFKEIVMSPVYHNLNIFGDLKVPTFRDFMEDIQRCYTTAFRPENQGKELILYARAVSRPYKAQQEQIFGLCDNILTRSRDLGDDQEPIAFWTVDTLESVHAPSSKKLNPLDLLSHPMSLDSKRSITLKQVMNSKDEKTLAINLFQFIKAMPPGNFLWQNIVANIFLTPNGEIPPERRKLFDKIFYMQQDLATNLIGPTFYPDLDTRAFDKSFQPVLNRMQYTLLGHMSVTIWNHLVTDPYALNIPDTVPFPRELTTQYPTALAYAHHLESDPDEIENTTRRAFTRFAVEYLNNHIQNIQRNLSQRFDDPLGTDGLITAIEALFLTDVSEQDGHVLANFLNGGHDSFVQKIAPFMPSIEEAVQANLAALDIKKVKRRLQKPKSYDIAVPTQKTKQSSIGELLHEQGFTALTLQKYEDSIQFLLETTIPDLSIYGLFADDGTIMPASIDLSQNPEVAAAIKFMISEALAAQTTDKQKVVREKKLKPQMTEEKAQLIINDLL